MKEVNKKIEMLNLQEILRDLEAILVEALNTDRMIEEMLVDRH